MAYVLTRLVDLALVCPGAERFLPHAALEAAGTVDNSGTTVVIGFGKAVLAAPA